MAQLNGIEKFVFTKDFTKYPDWFKDEAAKGRIKFENDDYTKEIIGANIITSTKTYHANTGDTIVMLKNGMVVLNPDETKKWMG